MEGGVGGRVERGVGGRVERGVGGRVEGGVGGDGGRESGRGRKEGVKKVKKGEMSGGNEFISSPPQRFHRRCTRDCRPVEVS